MAETARLQIALEAKVDDAIDGFKKVNKAVEDLAGKTLRQLQGAVDQVGADFSELGASVKTAKAQLEAFKGSPKQFNELAAGLVESKVAVQNLSNESTTSRTKLKNLREALVELGEAGLEGTRSFENLSIAAAKLQDRAGDTQARIRAMASDTFKLDAALQGIQAGAAAFQVVQGAAALFGQENENLLKTIAKLNAIMAVTNGLTQIQNALQKQTALSVALSNTQLAVAAAAQRVFAIAVGTSTGALRIFRVALFATGIGAVIGLIGLLIENWDEVGASIKRVIPGFTSFGDVVKSVITNSVGAIGGLIGALKQFAIILGNILSRDFDKVAVNAALFANAIKDGFAGARDAAGAFIDKFVGAKEKVKAVKEETVKLTKAAKDASDAFEGLGKFVNKTPLTGVGGRQSLVDTRDADARAVTKNKEFQGLLGLDKTLPLAEKLKALGPIEIITPANVELIKAMNAEFDKTKAIGDFITTSLGQVFQQFFVNLAEQGGNAMQQLIRSIGAMIKKLIAAAAAAALLAALLPGAGGAGLSFITRAKSLFSSFTGIPALATGGITTGPTLAMIGDNPSGREAVIPLERLHQFMGGGNNVNVNGEFVIRGNDLIATIDRNNNRRDRMF